MPYTIKVTLRSDKDAKQVAHTIAQLVESATGQKCTISVVNRRPAIKNQQKELDVRKQKLLR